MRVFIVGDYINAITLLKSIWRLNPSGLKEVICFNTSGINLLSSLYPTINSVDLTSDAQFRFRTYVEDNPYHSVTKVLLTNELLHEELFQNDEYYRSKGLEFHIGKSHPRNILDKNIFLSIIKKHRIADVPLSYELSDLIKYPVILKAKSTFKGAVKYKTKRIFHNQRELDTFRKSSKEDLSTYYLLQELLSTNPRDNVSVAGWYDPSGMKFVQSQKIFQHPKKMGTGDICKIMKPNYDLFKITEQVCDQFQYSGPFELEFVRGQNNSFKVLEFNPRFWMQHSICNAITGESITAKALGVKSIPEQKNYKYWINPLYVLPKVVSLNCKYVPYILKKQVYWPLTIKETMKALAFRVKI